jgi:hypothetical protein
MCVVCFSQRLYGGTRRDESLGVWNRFSGLGIELRAHPLNAPAVLTDQVAWGMPGAKPGFSRSSIEN